MKLLKRYYFDIIGGFVGSAAGFAYYWFIGCGTGTCPITSNPYISLGYGAMLGVLLFGLFKKNKEK